MRASEAAVMTADCVHCEQLQWKPQTLWSFLVRFARDLSGLRGHLVSRCSVA